MTRIIDPVGARNSHKTARHDPRRVTEPHTFYNEHRAHQGIANARPLKPLPEPITDPDRLARLTIRRRDRLGGILSEYEHAA
jgi:putative transposase